MRLKKIPRRGFAAVFGFICLTMLFLVLYADRRYGTLDFLRTFRYQPVPHLGYLINTEGCRMPYWDPWDPSVARYYRNRTVPLVCSPTPSFIVVKPNATLQIDYANLRNFHQIEPSKVRCDYRTILRDPGKPDRPTDESIVIEASKELVWNVSLETEFVHVACYNAGKIFHDEYLALTPLKPSVEERATRAAVNATFGERLNVILLGTDSVSKLNFVRHFPKTRKLLSELDAVELSGYNKVSDNTFPNMVPLLTGDFYQSIWNESVRDTFFFDEVDLIWRHFAAQGYRTLFAEDAPTMAIFNYNRKGFREPPTDYYLRPYSLAVEDSDMRRRSKTYCFDDRMESKVLYDYTRTFAETMGSRPFFTYVFAARLTHDDVNMAAYADQPAHEILSFLHSSGVANRSVIFFFSDHGMRFGKIRQTYVGKFEDRWPIMFLIFPDWFLDKYPRLARNLRTNRHRLTTPFDIHATLVDLLSLATGNTPVTSEASVRTRGISLFQEISSERTCEDAGILRHWCTCQTTVQIPPGRPDARQAAQLLVHEINRLLDHTSVCARLVLDQVRDVHITQFDEESPSYVWTEYATELLAPTDYIVSLSVTPSGALFEGTIQYDGKKKRHMILGEISRTNRYDHQSDCVSDAELKKFCYCKQL